MDVKKMVELAHTMVQNRVRENERREKPTLVESIVRMNKQHGRIEIIKDAYIKPGSVIAMEELGRILVHPDSVATLTATVKQVQILMAGEK